MSGNDDLKAIGLILPWVLTIVFMILKLCKAITWKWVWVFAPIWIWLAIAAVVVVITFYAIYTLMEDSGK